MKHIKLLGLFLALLATACSQQVKTEYRETKLSTPNPSVEAQALYRYLNDMYGKVMLSGQMWAPWGIEEVEYVYETTGKYPAVRGHDFIHEADNQNEVRLAIEWWKKGGIPTIMWHWGAPSVGEGYPNSKEEINIENCFIEGTVEYNEMWRELKAKAVHLEALRDAKVPVLWRPMHELNGHWFWYGKQGPENFKKLWRTMYNYYVHERGINNLIWVFCHTADIDTTWYPGNEYVDITGPDTYDGGNSAHSEMFENAHKLNTPYPIAYHECGVPPNPDQCLAQNAMWLWWMQWHTGHVQRTDKNYLKYVYNHDLVITLDEIPDIMALYNWDDNCKPSALSASIKLDNGKWRKNNMALFTDANKATFKAKTNEKGSWKWNGYGTKGNSNEQMVEIDTTGTALAMFTNQCGATSSIAFHIGEPREPCKPTPLSPMMKIGSADWTPINKATVKKGDSVWFGPHPVNGGSWQWTGNTSANTRELSICATENTLLKATHTNSCGTKSSIDFEIIVVEE
ncbi:MAG: hypothetical protein JW735_01735 [Prolixibacteraceae bacterium]|nr:hypothetical protein [Prolixibacteraceae bacterium]